MNLLLKKIKNIAALLTALTTGLIVCYYIFQVSPNSILTPKIPFGKITIPSYPLPTIFLKILFLLLILVILFYLVRRIDLSTGYPKELKFEALFDRSGIKQTMEEFDIAKFIADHGHIATSPRYYAAKQNYIFDEFDKVLRGLMGPNVQPFFSTILGSPITNMGVINITFKKVKEKLITDYQVKTAEGTITFGSQLDDQTVALKYVYKEDKAGSKVKVNWRGLVQNNLLLSINFSQQIEVSKNPGEAFRKEKLEEMEIWCMTRIYILPFPKSYSNTLFLVREFDKENQEYIYFPIGYGKYLFS